MPTINSTLVSNTLVSNNITHKAGTVFSNNFPNINSILDIVRTDDSIKTYSAPDLIKLNKGWANVCCNKNANTAAGVPIKLYYVTNSKSLPKRSSFKLLSKKVQAKVARGLKIDLTTDQQVVEIMDHQFLTLMETVNSTMNNFDFISLVHNYLGLIGNCYVEIVKGEDGLPSELHPLISEYVKIKADNMLDGKITNYLYKLPDMQEPKTYSPDNVLHFINYQPGSNLIGFGELESCLVAVNLYNYYDLFECRLNKNFGQPDYIAHIKGQANQKTKEELYIQLAKRCSGKNVGKPLVVTGDVEIKELNFRPREMMFNQGREWCLRNILATFGIPEALIKLENANRASAVISVNQYYSLTIFPKLSRFCQKLNEKLIPMYGQDGLYCWFDYGVLESDPLERSSILNSYVASGIMDINEAREQLNLGEKEETDETDELEEPVDELEEPIDEPSNMGD